MATSLLFTGGEPDAVGEISPCEGFLWLSPSFAERAGGNLVIPRTFGNFKRVTSEVYNSLSDDLTQHCRLIGGITEEKSNDNCCLF